jgi:acyl-CoA thioesterase-1
MTLRILLFWLVIAFPVVAATPKILVLGDSLSAGYGLDAGQSWVAQLNPQLEDEIGFPVEILNASISGDTSAGGLSRLPGLMDRHQPDYVLIALGANDGLRGLPLDGLQANLVAMIELVRARQAVPLFAGIELPRNYGGPYTRAFRATQDQVAEQTGVGYLEFLLEPIALDRSQFQADGLHPTRDAQPVIRDHVVSFLSDHIER